MSARCRCSATGRHFKKKLPSADINPFAEQPRDFQGGGLWKRNVGDAIERVLSGARDFKHLGVRACRYVELDDEFVRVNVKAREFQ